MWSMFHMKTTTTTMIRGQNRMFFVKKKKKKSPPIQHQPGMDKEIASLLTILARCNKVMEKI